MRRWLVLRLPWPAPAERKREQLRLTACEQDLAALRSENARLREKTDELRKALLAERRRNLDANQVRAQRDHLKHEVQEHARRREAAERDLEAARRELDLLRQQTGGNR